MRTRSSTDPRSGSETARREAPALQLGGMLAVLGGFGYFVLLLLHGDLPDHTAEAALEHIAGRPEWPFLKLGLIVSVLFWVGAFVALASSMTRAWSSLLARLASACLVIGAGLVVVEYSILGYGVKNVADAWIASSGPEREARLLVGEAMLGVSGGLFLSFIAWLLGLPFLLLGLAVRLDGGYPHGWGWPAMIGGAGALVSGITRFVGIELVPFPILYGGFVLPLNLWLGVMGVVMIRRGATA